MKAKSILLRSALAALVGLSLFLTWVIWFNPSHAVKKSADEVSVKTTTTKSVEKTENSVFNPDSVYVTSDGTKQLVVSDTKSISSRIHDNIKSWRINYVATGHRLSDHEYNSFVAMDASVQLTYSDKMSWYLFNKLYFTQRAKKQGNDFAFDRIMIDTRAQVLVFANDETRHVWTVHLSGVDSFAGVNAAVAKASTSYPVVEQRMQDHFVAMFQAPIKVRPYSYLIDKQNANHYVTALMNDGASSASSVDSKQIGNQTVYTTADNNQRLVVDKNDSTMQFENFAASTPVNGRANVLNSAYADMMSLDISEMSGMHYVSFNSTSLEVTFQMFVAGLPLFDSSMNSAVQVTHTTSSKKITFSGTNLSVPVPTDEASVTLPSSETVYTKLTNVGFKPSQIRDITPGYGWEDDPDSTLVVNLTPKYFVNIDGTYYEYSDIVSGKVTPATVAGSAATSTGTATMNMGGLTSGLSTN